MQRNRFFNDVWRLELATWTWECCDIGSLEEDMGHQMMMQMLHMHNNNNIDAIDNAEDSDDGMDNADAVAAEDAARVHNVPADVSHARPAVFAAMPADAPCGRYRHEMVMLPQGRIAVIGGGWPFPLTGTRIDAIALYDTHARQWLRQPCSSIAPGQEIPLARRSHTCTLVGDNVYMLGGTDGGGVFPWEHVWVLNATTFTWRKLANVWPVPSYFHTTVATDEGYLLTFGGVDVTGYVRCFLMPEAAMSVLLCMCCYMHWY